MGLDLGLRQVESIAEDEGQDGHDQAVQEEVGEEADADGADDEEGVGAVAEGEGGVGVVWSVGEGGAETAEEGGHCWEHYEIRRWESPALVLPNLLSSVCVLALPITELGFRNSAVNYGAP